MKRREATASTLAVASLHSRYALGSKSSSLFHSQYAKLQYLSRRTHSCVLKGHFHYRFPGKGGATNPLATAKLSLSTFPTKSNVQIFVAESGAAPALSATIIAMCIADIWLRNVFHLPGDHRNAGFQMWFEYG